MSERLLRPRASMGRTALSRALLAIFFAIAPSTIEPWRLDPSIRHAVTLTVGAPVRWLDP